MDGRYTARQQVIASEEMMARWYPLSEAAEMLGLARDTLRSQIRFGTIRAKKVGPIWTMSDTEIERYRTMSLGKRNKKVDAGE